MITPATRYSIFPVTQQIVGVATIASNLIKTICDLFKIAYRKQETIVKKNAYFTCSVNFKKTLKVENRLIRYRSSRAIRADKAARAAIEKLDLAKKDLKEHLRYIGIGVIRMTPIVGSVYSYVQWSQAKKQARA